MFGRGHHWTDRAGSLPSYSEPIDIRSYRAERKKILSLINEILSPFELKAEDWDGESFEIYLRSGASQKAANLSELWNVVEQLIGTPIDPLSPLFLAYK